MVLEQLAEIGLEADVLLEPTRRDSGPAIAAGAAFAQMRDSDAVVLALAADHVVRRHRRLRRRLPAGTGRGRRGPHRDLRRPAGAPRHRIRLYQPGRGRSPARSARWRKFVEKPDPATAADYIKAGYLWNSGNFMFRASVLLDEYRKRRCRERAGGHATPSARPGAISASSRSIRTRSRRPRRSRSTMR